MTKNEGNAGRGRIKGVLFDKDGTLFDYHGTWGPILSEVAAALAGEQVSLVPAMLASIGYREQTGRFEAGRLTRAPVVVTVVSRLTPGIKIPEWEQLLSAGAVCQNMLIAATALGFGAQWLTEWYAFDADVNRALELGENEKIAGYLYFGSESVAKDERPRPELSEITSEWRARES